MPTLTRLLVTLASLAIFAWGVMVALATFVEPEQVRMTIDVPVPGFEDDDGTDNGGSGNRGSGNGRTGG
jgi:hypothetical protein